MQLLFFFYKNKKKNFFVTPCNGIYLWDIGDKKFYYIFVLFFILFIFLLWCIFWHTDKFKY